MITRGWQRAIGIATAFRLHGDCSTDGWLVRLPDSFAIQGDHCGDLHTDDAGHRAYAAAIFDAIVQ